MPPNSKEPSPSRRTRSTRVSLRAIRKLASEIVEKFRPEKIILFGSYAYGEPNPDSDVDLLIVMSARNEIDQAVKILRVLENRPFPLDLIVRTPKRLQWRIAEGDWFLREIVGKGKILYEAAHERVD